ncbi:MAG: D-alanyl-D-alanine carboxypeptidase family protein [Myxococcales bacterium]|nr:D-alanyl-D-alanine carboxypeptidase family protein [Myxococcales bacterium]
MLALLLTLAAMVGEAKPTSLRQRPSHPSAVDLYGATDPWAYLTGQFEPAKHPLFIRIRGLGPRSKRHWLRREAAEALVRMFRALRQAIPGAALTVRSGARTFAFQAKVWDLRFHSSRGNARERGLHVMRWFAMPGTSRHHWGTEVDILEFSNHYFQRGIGRRIYRWLQANAARYGYCQPFTRGRQHGYREERWHWSYRPLARHFRQEWLRRFARFPNPATALGPFAGRQTLAPLAPTYVANVDPGCR